MNLCLEHNIFPSSLKIAKNVPLFKEGDKNCLSNYRPISLLPSMSKFFERVIHSQLSNYFVQNNLFHDSQYGYRTGHNIENALSDLVENVLGAFQENKIPLSILCDLSKAFDTVDHDILIWKLRKYGLSSNAVELINNYLTDREQYVYIMGGDV